MLKALRLRLKCCKVGNLARHEQGDGTMNGLQDSFVQYVGLMVNSEIVSGPKQEDIVGRDSGKG